MPVTVRHPLLLAVAVIPASMLLGGCRSYEPHPLDVDRHRAAWASRSPDDQQVAAFAQRLAAAEGVPETFNAADGLSIHEAEGVALFFNPDLRVARLRADAARASAATAGMWEDPEFGFDAAYILADVSDPWIAGATLGITFPISGRLETEKAHAGAEHRAALERLAAREWATRAQLRVVWFEWSALVLHIDQTRAFLADLDRVVSIADLLEKAGEMARPEARLFRVERITRHNDLRLLEAQAQEAEIGIRALLGLTPDAPVHLTPTLAGEQAPETPNRSEMERRNPTLASLRAEYEVAEQALRHEIRKQYPDITIGPGAGTEDGDPRVLLGVSLPIPLWNRNQRGVAEAESLRAVARAEFEAGVEALGARLAAAEVRHRAVTAQRRELEEVVVPMVDEQSADLERIAQAGDFNVLLTLETLVRRHETKVRLIGARLEEARARAAIEELLGPRVSSPPPTAAEAPMEIMP